MKQFTYQVRKDKVQIMWNNQIVQTLSNDKASHFLEQVEELSEEDEQLFMAKLTGNFKRGNERLAKRHVRNQD